MSLWKSKKIDAVSSDFYSEGGFDSVECTAGALTAGLDPNGETYAAQVIDRLFGWAVELGASDIHLDASSEGHLVRLRIDGSLRELGTIPAGKLTSLGARLKALAKLLTYRNDIPQEGRLERPGLGLEARVVTLPTLHGERIVIRLGGRRQKAWRLDDLSMDARTSALLHQAVSAPSGVILITGPVGSGKTTTAYAILRTLLHVGVESNERRCIVTLEDPIECELPGTAQSQIEPNAGFDWASGLRALLRQDPEIMLIGEIRDAETAQTAFRAAMTGQLVVTTMHARSVADSLIRLVDLKVPTQHILAGLQLTISQRLVRRLCDCARNVPSGGVVGCSVCDFTGMNGRAPLAEAHGELTGPLARAVSAEADQAELQRLAVADGLITLASAAEEMIRAGLTTPEEVSLHLRGTN